MNMNAQEMFTLQARARLILEPEAPAVVSPAAPKYDVVIYPPADSKKRLASGEFMRQVLDYIDQHAGTEFKTEDLYTPCGIEASRSVDLYNLLYRLKVTKRIRCVKRGRFNCYSSVKAPVKVALSSAPIQQSISASMTTLSIDSAPPNATPGPSTWPTSKLGPMASPPR